jgi:hypothetical protein
VKARCIESDKAMEMIKTLTAIKLCKNDNNPGQVLKNLYIGSIGAAYSDKSLERVGITHILTVAKSIKPRFEDKFVYKIIPAIDSNEANILEFF